MEELELKEDYSGLSREEALEMAEEGLKKVRKLHSTGQNYSKMEKPLLEASKVFKYFGELENYVFCQNWLASIDLVIGKNKKAFTRLEDNLQFAIQNVPSESRALAKVYYNLSEYYVNIDNHKKSVFYGLKNLAIIQASDYRKSYPLDVYSALILMSCEYKEMYEYNLAQKYVEEALAFGNENWGDSVNSVKKWGKNSMLLANCFSHLSSIASKKGDIFKAFEYGKEGLKIITTVFGEFHLYSTYFYDGFSNYYTHIGDYDKSLLYVKKILDIRKKVLPENSSLIGIAYWTLALNYLNLDEPLTAISTLNKALSIFENRQEKNNVSTAKVLGSLGNAYHKLQKNDKAIEFTKRALQIFISRKDQAQTAFQYHKLALYINDFEEQMSYLQKAVAIQKNIYGEKNIQLGIYYMYIAKTYKKASNYDQALIFAQKSICSLALDYNETDVFLLPPLQKILSSHNYILVLALKSNTLYLAFLQTQENIYLTLALQHYQLIVEFYNQTQKNYQTEGSKLSLSKIIMDAYAQGLKTFFAAHTIQNIPNTLESAFQFSENAKAILLLSTQQDIVAKTASDIPPHLLNQEKQLKIELTHLEKKIQQQEVKGDKKDEELVQKWQNEYFDYHQEYTQLLQQLETDYPDYYQLKYDTKTITPTELQSALQENQVVLSYFIGEDKLYIFVVTPDEFEVIDLQLPTDFEALVQDFMDALTQHQQTAFIQKSYQLHQLLIAPIRDFLVDDFVFDEEEEELKQVFVIPHGVLSYLPFEALIGSPLPQPLARREAVAKVSARTETPEQSGRVVPTISNFGNSWSELDYLIHHCEISYHYSATLLYRHLLKKQTEEEFPNSFAGFAPIYDATPIDSKTPNQTKSDALQQSAKSMQAWATRSEAIRSDGTWVSLPHSETEAKGIAELFEEKGLKAETFLREKASKEGFAEAAKRFKFLLVAAHGLVNDEKTALSGLVFYPSMGESRNLGNKHRTLNDEFPITDNQSPVPNHQSDNILSMEETHHLDFQADLVVLSSCESGIGTLHKGEGMMAVNRGFLAAGANNVVSTLFKVYDKPSSLLTQYFFEEILEGKSYTAALRAAKLKLMQQPNIDPKSWSGFVLIGGD